MRGNGNVPPFMMGDKKSTEDAAKKPDNDKGPKKQ